MSDLYKPAEIAGLVRRSGVAKTEAPSSALFVLAVLAGVFIAFGAAFYTVAITGADAGAGPVRVLGGLTFSLGLILVIVGGAELFTGNALIVMAWVDKLITTRALLRNWAIVYAGNLFGSLLLAGGVALTGLLAGPFGETAARIAAAKFALEPLEVFARAVLCNALVCLAVWLSFAARTAAGKILGIIFPISAFVALGFEHSVANMYLLPVGMIAGAVGTVADAVVNIAIATIGNIIGGAGGVALAYHFAFKGQHG
ncbi:formate/nitrite transporter family protein [Oricola cellulosilytica]|uniref:Formate/nitrite transporter family protein n=1 Tax=Oricola cellulosilytica TaxID=1429082 RepID=A0A4R0PIG2_9HYPH|nr:formate/nitrite transporter family protein [Oricola cellulosilytica]TCD15304.1 formate/nitrite transporter family protein [Oricola cellulosilytica]